MFAKGRYIPFLLFSLIIGFGYAGFKLNDPSLLPSALIGKSFPNFRATLLGDEGRSVDRSDLLGSPVLVNVWATWCPTCKSEHSLLMDISKTTELRLVGINYKDEPKAALEWLISNGDPYEFTLQDRDGSLGIELGVYGAPESFLLDQDGTVIYKRVGDINLEIWEEELGPSLRRLWKQGN